jgi:hypothetical protein
MTEPRDDDTDVGQPQTEPTPGDPELDPDVRTDAVPTHPDDPSSSEDDAAVAHEAPEEA